MPRVSIILPVYNGEDYLEQSIQSVIDQTFHDWELIIVDDGSKDSSASIAQKYTKLDSRIYVIQNDNNIKLPATLNHGFSKAKGEYWTWTSCDNAYTPHAIQYLVNSLDQNSDIGLVYSDMDLINDQGEKIGHIQAGLPQDLIMRNVIGACFMYRKNIANIVGDYNLDCFLCEDYEYWLRIAKKTKIMPIDKTLYTYRQHDKSLSSERERDIIKRGIEIQKNYYNEFIYSKKDSARFYAHLRGRDIYNPLRQFYLLYVLMYSPFLFITEIYGLIKRRFTYEKS